jgi:hypothetical protein
MTGQLLRMTAKELAGAQYDKFRLFGSERFAKECPSEREYVARHWPHFIMQAKAALCLVLESENTPEHQKQAIFEELLRHAEDSQSPNAVDILQVTTDPREKEDVRYVDEHPQLRTVEA